MLQFDVRVTLNKYDETTGQKEPQFDWSEKLAKEAEAYLEYALIRSPVLVTDDNGIYVCTISHLRKVK